MNKKLKCILCGALACLCLAGPVLAPDFNPKHANDLSKPVAMVMATATSLSTTDQGTLYVTHTMGGADVKAVFLEPVKISKLRH